MGCGASSTTNSPTNDLSDAEQQIEHNPDSSIIREIHEWIAKEDKDTLPMQRLLFPLCQETLKEVKSDYKHKYGQSITQTTVLEEGPLWALLLCEDMARQQLEKLLDKGGSDVLLLVDIVMSLQLDTEMAKVFYQEAVQKLNSVFIAEKDVLHLIECSVSDRPQTVKLVDEREISIAVPSAYFANRIRNLLSDTNTPDALYILLMRREVDLGEIAIRYKTAFSESLWDRFSSTYALIQLLDLSPTKQLSDNSSCEPILLHSELVESSYTSASKNGTVEVSHDGVSNTKQGSSEKTVPTAPSPDRSLAFDSIPSPGVITVQSPLPVSDPEGDSTPRADSIPRTDTIPHTDKVPAADTTLNVNVAANVSVHDAVEDSEDIVEKTPTTGKKMATEIPFEDQLKELHRLLSDPKAGGDEIILALVNILSLKSYDVRKHFSSTYNEDLMGVLEGKLSKEAFKATEYLMLKYLKASSLLLAEAINENDHSTVDQILMVLLCSSTQQVRDIVKEFPKATERRNLSEVLTENLLGEFQRFIAALLKGDRDEDLITNEDVAKSDACRLHTATDFKWDGEDNVFNEVFIKRNLQQLKLTFAFFYDESGTDITELILQEFTFHLQKALLNLVYIANNGLTKFLAKFVYESKSKSHFKSVLIWIVAARFDVDLKEVSTEYKTKYGSPLTDLISGANLPEDCENLLINLCLSQV